jgi:hypothetical protein
MQPNLQGKAFSFLWVTRSLDFSSHRGEVLGTIGCVTRPQAIVSTAGDVAARPRLRSTRPITSAPSSAASHECYPTASHAPRHSASGGRLLPERSCLDMGARSRCDAGRVFGAQPLDGERRRHFRLTSGRVTLVQEDPSQSTVEAVIDATSVDTGEPKRDRHLPPPCIGMYTKSPFRRSRSPISAFWDTRLGRRRLAGQ